MFICDGCFARFYYYKRELGKEFNECKHQYCTNCWKETDIDCPSCRMSICSLGTRKCAEMNKHVFHRRVFDTWSRMMQLNRRAELRRLHDLIFVGGQMRKYTIEKVDENGQPYILKVREYITIIK